MALSFALVNVTGISAHVIFKFNTHSQTSQRVSLKNLCFKLMSRHLEQRKTVLSLPKDIRYFLNPNSEPVASTSASTSASNVPTKRGRCQICGRHGDKFTSMRCTLCLRWVCKGRLTFLQSGRNHYKAHQCVFLSHQPGGRIRVKANHKQNKRIY